MGREMWFWVPKSAPRANRSALEETLVRHCLDENGYDKGIVLFVGTVFKRFGATDRPIDILGNQYSQSYYQNKEANRKCLILRRMAEGKPEIPDSPIRIRKGKKKSVFLVYRTGKDFHCRRMLPLVNCHQCMRTK
ncbi:hypothetical protein CEXT_79671 [Caerostris extrusa]|uniref:Uncharacterized protein n=1 Tax=Caerostris extrusa TaxID=172846 RepID=A0AAV4UYB8_CAEEX|nr:hypothetical protein CEXT_79671 [Caerostris extrusa]